MFNLNRYALFQKNKKYFIKTVDKYEQCAYIVLAREM